MYPEIDYKLEYEIYPDAELDQEDDEELLEEEFELFDEDGLISLDHDHDRRCLLLKNDYNDRALYVAINGQPYHLIRPEQTHRFIINQTLITFSIIELKDTSSIPALNQCLEEPIYHVAFSLDPQSPSGFTLNYSTVRAMPGLYKSEII